MIPPVGVRQGLSAEGLFVSVAMPAHSRCEAYPPFGNCYTINSSKILSRNDYANFDSTINKFSEIIWRNDAKAFTQTDARKYRLKLCKCSCAHPMSRFLTLPSSELMLQPYSKSLHCFFTFSSKMPAFATFLLEMEELGP